MSFITLSTEIGMAGIVAPCLRIIRKSTPIFWKGLDETLKEVTQADS